MNRCPSLIIFIEKLNEYYYPVIGWKNKHTTWIKNVFSLVNARVSLGNCCLLRIPVSPVLNLNRIRFVFYFSLLFNILAKNISSGNFTNQLIAFQFGITVYLSIYIFWLVFSIKKIILHRIQTMRSKIWKKLRITRKWNFLEFFQWSFKYSFQFMRKKFVYFKIMYEKK